MYHKIDVPVCRGLLSGETYFSTSLLQCFVTFKMMKQIYCLTKGRKILYHFSLQKQWHLPWRRMTAPYWTRDQL